MDRLVVPVSPASASTQPARPHGAVPTRAHRKATSREQLSFEYREALHSDCWAELRRAAADRSRGAVGGPARCERCRRPEHKVRLALHHRGYASLGAETLADVLLLCEKCHRRADRRRRRRMSACGPGAKSVARYRAPQTSVVNGGDLLAASQTTEGRGAIGRAAEPLGPRNPTHENDGLLRARPGESSLAASAVPPGKGGS